MWKMRDHGQTPKGGEAKVEARGIGPCIFRLEGLNGMEKNIELKIDSVKVNDYTVIRLEGEVDVYSAPLLREEIIKQVERGEYKLVVDLEKVNFLDSTGLGVLVGGLKRVKPNDGELGIICNQDKILRIFRITGLDKIFPIFDNIDELKRRQAGG
jgi:anti-sigma B factor antagonist